jgi:hypothetical protein
VTDLPAFFTEWNMNNMSVHLRRTSPVQAIANEMLAFCGPIFITPGLLTYPEQMIDNGTYSLINTGRRQLLVTCHHVWQAYLDHRAMNSETALCVNLGDGDASIAFAKPESQLIDYDPDLDLAVFDFEPQQILVNGAQVKHQKDWFPIHTWPISKANDKGHVVLMGFPGKFIKKNKQPCTFTGQPVRLKITGVGQKAIFVLNEGENVEVFNVIKNWLGGLSGSPAYTLTEKGASLVGFVKSGYKQSNSTAAGNSLFAGRLLMPHDSFLNPDGILSH